MQINAVVSLFLRKQCVQILYKWRRVCLAYLYIREIHLEHIWAWVPGVEKHELGFLQMIGRETLLDLKIAAFKDINDMEVDQGNECDDIIYSVLEY